MHAARRFAELHGIAVRSKANCRLIAQFAGRFSRLALLAGLVAPRLAACERLPPDTQTAETTVTRTFVDRVRDTLFVAGGIEDDTLLLLPGPMEAGDGRVVVYDYGDARVKSFGSDGRLQWMVGQRGQGPGEFMNGFDLRIAPGGDVWVADDGNGRVTVLTRSGELREIFNFPAGHTLQRLVLLERDTLALPLMPEPSEFWIDLGGAGSGAAGPLPDSLLAAGHSYYRQAVIAIAPERRRWGAVFLFADRFVIYDRRHSVCTGRLVKGTPPLAEVEPGGEPPIWAAGAFWTESTFVILARDRDQPGDLRVLDEFGSDCRYLRSHSLPMRTVKVAWDAGILYLAFEDPAPGIVALDW